MNQSLQTRGGNEVAQSTSDASAGDTRAMIPRADVIEDDAGIQLIADLPGVAREQLELNVEGDTLTIEGVVNAAAPEGIQAIYAELPVPRFRRAFTLSRELDSSRIEASMSHGVLTLRIPKTAQAQPRRITVSG